MTTPPLRDAPERDRIRSDTSSTLFVNAGAGSGKTTALVNRVRTLVLTDGVPLSQIAAVTFTEKAGAELRDRLRAAFEREWRKDRAGSVRSQQALDDLDGAAIGTLHAFAQRLLMEHPIEAGLPPVIEVLDEVGSSVAFEERWSELQTAILDDQVIAEPLLLAMAGGMTLKNVRSLALALGKDWDLITERILSAPAAPTRMPDLQTFTAAARGVLDNRRHCVNAEDKLLAKLSELAEFVTQLEAAPDAESQLAALQRIARMKYGNHGDRRRWAVPTTEVRAAGVQLADDAGALVGQVLDRCLRRVTGWIAEQVLDAAQTRRREGTLEFHDLLVLARDLLRRDATVRSALHDRYTRLLLDEFQDTDPIQIELAVRIAGGAPADAARWQDVDVPAGRLFVVGDAKQSIYRFRRASVATYLDAQRRIGDPASLTTNFRSVGPILAWVNDVFGHLIYYQEDGQPDYVALDAARSDAGTGPEVTILGADAHADAPRAAVLREREAADVAAVIHQALDEGWQVFDERTNQWRRATRDDIAVLLPARTSLPHLEDALDRAHIPYRAEASSLVYQASEVRALLACARAVADTSDALALVTALRSPVFGCGDDDLWRWKHAGGSYTIYSELDAAEPLAFGPVGSALTYLRTLSFDARWLTPSEVLGAIITDRRMFEVAAVGPRARDSWRRLRFVVDQARAWSEVSHGGLRAYLAWAAHQGQETSRVAEAILPETDSNAVRVMTVHAAKGLEFPIVILSGMTSQPANGRGVRLLWPPAGGFSVKLSQDVQTGDFDLIQPVDEQMDGLERLRLLYVGATRARDHLVVSLHRAEGSKSATAASILAGAGAGTAAGATHFEGYSVAGSAADGSSPVSAPPAFTEWLAAITVARKRSRAITAISASGLEGTEPEVVFAVPAVGTPGADEAGLAKGARDLELPPWSKGRYGSAIGRAVHGVLQVVDLATGSGVGQATAAQVVAEGVVGQESLVRALVESALANDVVARAAAREHWRETYVGTVRADGTVLEGYIDLIYRDDDGGLVVVDYKTDAVPAGAIPSRVAYYRPQMAAYTEALTTATGGAVSAVLVFLNPVASTAVPIS